MTRTRNNIRRAATTKNAKRTILGAIDENEGPQEDSSSSGFPMKNSVENSIPTIDNSFNVPQDIDVTKGDAMKVLLQDLEKGSKQHQEIISIRASQATGALREAYFLGTMKLEKSIKNMTIRDFNKKYMDGGDIVNYLKEISDSLVADDGGRKKRVRPTAGENLNQYASMELETPLRNIRPQTGLATPVSVPRTVRRGEALYSANGSPVDQNEEGDLVATVSKKRRGHDAAIFDINVGEGRYVSLSDVTTLEHLDHEMKNTAMSQLKVLQDQMASLMAKLGK